MPENKTFNLLSDNKVWFCNSFVCSLFFISLFKELWCDFFPFLFKKQIKWVEQQHVLERDKRNVVPEYIPTVHPEAYTIRDPLFSQQWYLVSFSNNLCVNYEHLVLEIYCQLIKFCFRTILVNQMDPQNLMLMFYQYGVVEFREKMW